MTPVGEMEKSGVGIHPFQKFNNTNGNAGGQTKRQMSEKQKQKFVEQVAHAWATSSAVSWSEFTQNTTFHGVKYIFDPGAFKSRRICWTVFVITSVFCFMLQVGLRLGTYYEYNTNVDVEKIYTTKVVFPAVTICNQNSFRLTKTSEFGLYDFIDAIFGNDPNASRHALLNAKDYTMDTTEFWLNTSHQFDDLIDSCTWKGSDCNLTSDWVVTMTDMGVCYTFNYDPENPQQVVEAGAGLGLSLILNLEQYEYMNGPQNDAGIKILLHDPAEFPMLKDLGFAAAPGTHTLVGVNSFQVTSLPPPFGVCDSLMDGHMSDCRIQCRSQEIVDRCGCRDVYMPNTNENSTVCEMQVAFGCVSQALADLQGQETNCTCNIPCERSTYEPSLSNAQLSRFSVDRLVLRDREKRARVLHQFQSAREVFQRVDTETADTDRKTLQRIQKKVYDLRTIVDSHVTGLEMGFETDLLDGLSSALADDKGRIESRSSEIEEHMDRWRSYFSLTRHKFDNVNRFIEGFGTGHINPTVLAEHLSSCANYLEGSGESGSVEIGGGAPPDPSAGPVVVDTSACLTLPDQITEVLNIQPVYTDIINFVFNNTGVSPTSEYHYECVEGLARFSEADRSSQIKEVANLLADVLEEPNDAMVMSRAATTLTAAEAAGFDNLTEHLDNMEDICGEWYEEECDGHDDGYAIIVKLENAITYFTSARGVYDQYVTRIEKIKDLLDKNINIVMTAADDYLNNDITKAEMSRLFNSFLVKKGVEDLISETMELSSTVKEYSSKINYVENSVVGAYGIAFDQCLPLMNDEIIANMSSIATLLNLNKTEINNLYTNIADDRRGNFFKIIALGFDQMGVTFGEAEKLLSPLVDDVTDFIDAYKEELTTYSASIKMDENFFMQNFLQVDFFYRELNYEKVIQRPAFELLSLLGEVGGFLGLLLGASVLTVCEVMDYIIMLSLNRMRRGKTPVQPMRHK